MLVSARALTVLVVAHNDSKKLLATIERIYNALAVTVEDFSIVVFDDGSTDDTLAVAKVASDKYPFVIVRRNDRRMGPGYCIIAGSREARTPFVVWAPADNTWPLRSFVDLFGNLGQGRRRHVLCQQSSGRDAVFQASGVAVLYHNPQSLCSAA